MIIAAAIIGLITAYYMGTRPGIYAAAASSALFFLALAVPAFSFYCYVAVAIGVATIVTIGPRLERSPSNQRAAKALRQVAGQLGKAARRWWQSLD